MADEPELQLRADDFRRGWAHAFAVHVQDRVEAARQQQAAVKHLDEVLNNLQNLAQFSVEALHAAELRSDEHHASLVEASRRVAAEVEAEIRAVGSQVAAQIHSALELVQRESTELDESRQALEALRGTIAKEQRELAVAKLELAKQRAEFNSLSVWQRLFAKA